MSVRHSEQKRAQWAYDTVKRLKEENKKEQKELKSHIRKLPSHIQTSGLAQTLLFYGKKQPDIADKLREQLALQGNDVAASVRYLVADAGRVRMKTREAMDAAQWLKRFAEVMLEE
jgi:CRISPR-associated protein Cmr5